MDEAVKDLTNEKLYAEKIAMDLLGNYSPVTCLEIVQMLRKTLSIEFSEMSKSAADEANIKNDWAKKLGELSSLV